MIRKHLFVPVKATYTGLFPARKYRAAIRIATPFSTCSRMIDCSKSYRSFVVNLLSDIINAITQPISENYFIVMKDKIGRTGLHVLIKRRKCNPKISGSIRY